MSEFQNLRITGADKKQVDVIDPKSELATVSFILSSTPDDKWSEIFHKREEIRTGTVSTQNVRISEDRIACDCLLIQLAGAYDTLKRIVEATNAEFRAHLAREQDKSDAEDKFRQSFIQEIDSLKFD